MRQLLLLAAMAASVHVSAQKFNVVKTGTCGTTGYGWPCTGATTPTGFSYSDPNVSDTYYINDGVTTAVFGDNGDGKHYAAGNYVVSGTQLNSWYMQRDATTGQPTYIARWDDGVTFGYPSSDCGIRDITVNASANRAYILGYFGTGAPSAMRNYLRCINTTTGAVVWQTLISATAGLYAAVDLLVDNSGNIHVLANDLVSGGFVVRLYSPAGFPSTMFMSSSGSSLSFPTAFNFDIENSSGNIYICGQTGSQGFVMGLTSSYLLLDEQTDANATSGYRDLDFESSGDLFVMGYNGTNTMWQKWDVTSTPFTTIGLGGTSTSVDFPRKLIIDPNGRHTILAQGPITGNSVTHITTDVDWTTDYYGFNVWGAIHKDNNGDIILGSTDALNLQYITRLNYTGGPTSWTNYENKSTTSVSSLEKDNSIVLHPNPATNRLSIDLKNNDANNYRIINSMGQMVSKGYMLAPRATIDVSMLQSGQYYLQLLNNTQTINTQTFTKQ